MLQGYEGRHSTYQILHFIINANGPHIYGQYKQCVREIISRMNIKDPDAETLRELYIFYDIYLQLKDKIDFNKMDELEADFWTFKLKRRVAIEVLTMGRPSFGTLETILNMPNSETMMSFIDSMSAPMMAKRFLFQPHEPLRLKTIDASERKHNWISDIDFKGGGIIEHNKVRFLEEGDQEIEYTNEDGQAIDI